jgi:predicted lipoprotein with Yx(FWY)xxD motif
MKKGYLALIAFAVLGALVIAGCGSSNSETTGESASGGSAENASSESSGSGSAYGGGAYGGGGESSSNTASETSSGSGETTFVSTGKAGDLGMVIVDSEGMTLYDFHKDKGTMSSCYGKCEEFWPPLTTSGKPTGKNGAEASMLGTTERKDGTMQVTYAGHPLYTFVEDKKPGEANGNDFSAFGAQWYALMPNGEEPPD